MYWKTLGAMAWQKKKKAIVCTHRNVYTLVCGGPVVATNLAIDDSLLTQALKIGGLKTKKDTVTVALEEFIQRRKMEDVISLFGNIEYEKGYDYKRLRKRA